MRSSSSKATEPKIADMITINIFGTGAPLGMLLTSRTIDPARESERLRSMTPDRMRIASHLMMKEPLRSCLLAHKVICEWLHQDPRKQKPQAREDARKYLESQILELGGQPGIPGLSGGWLTSCLPTSEAPDVERTIIHALSSFRNMIGKRQVYVFGREK